MRWWHLCWLYQVLYRQLWVCHKLLLRPCDFGMCVPIACGHGTANAGDLCFVWCKSRGSNEWLAIKAISDRVMTLDVMLAACMSSGFGLSPHQQTSGKMWGWFLSYNVYWCVVSRLDFVIFFFNCREAWVQKNLKFLENLIEFWKSIIFFLMLIGRNLILMLMIEPSLLPRSACI